MREKTYRRLEGLSRIRGGYLSTKELLTAGLTNRQIAALTRENRLQKISHGVYYLEEEDGQAVRSQGAGDGHGQ